MSSELLFDSVVCESNLFRAVCNGSSFVQLFPSSKREKEQKQEEKEKEQKSSQVPRLCGEISSTSNNSSHKSKGMILASAISPDNQFLAIATASSSTIFLFSLETMKFIKTLNNSNNTNNNNTSPTRQNQQKPSAGGQGFITSLLFTDDCLSLICACSEYVLFFDIETGIFLGELGGSNGNISSLSLARSEGGNSFELVAGSSLLQGLKKVSSSANNSSKMNNDHLDGIVSIWNLETGRSKKVPSPTSSSSFSSSSPTHSSSPSSTPKKNDSKNKNNNKKKNSNALPLSQSPFFKNSDLVKKSNPVPEYKLHKQTPLKILTESGGVSCVAVSGSSRVIAAGYRSGSLVLWKAAGTQTPIARKSKVFLNNNPILSLSFAGKRLLVSGGSQVKDFDFSENKNSEEEGEEAEHGKTIFSSSKGESDLVYFSSWSKDLSKILIVTRLGEFTVLSTSGYNKLHSVNLFSLCPKSQETSSSSSSSSSVSNLDENILTSIDLSQDDSLLSVATVGGRIFVFSLSNLTNVPLGHPRNMIECSNNEGKNSSSSSSFSVAISKLEFIEDVQEEQSEKAKQEEEEEKKKKNNNKRTFIRAYDTTFKKSKTINAKYFFSSLNSTSPSSSPSSSFNTATSTSDRQLEAEALLEASLNSSSTTTTTLSLSSPPHPSSSSPLVSPLKLKMMIASQSNSNNNATTPSSETEREIGLN